MLALLLLAPAWMHPVLGQLRLGGEYELYSGVGLANGPIPYSLRARLRLRARYEDTGWMVYSAARVSNDLWDPQEGGEPGPFRPRLLEAFLDLYLDNMDVRVGHQLVVWGQMDGTFITDVVSPLDLSEFLAQDFEDIRLAVPAVQATYFSEEWSLTGLLVAAPVESPIPTTESPWFAIPAEFEATPISLVDDNLPSLSVDEVEPGLKLTYSGIRTTASLIYFYGRNRIPAFSKSVKVISDSSLEIVLTPDYFRRHVVGGRLSTSMIDPLIVEGEIAYESLYRSDVDPNVLLENPALDLLANGLLLRQGHVHAGLSVSRSFGQTLVKAQVLGSLLTRYDNRGARDEFQEAMTLLAQTSSRAETYTGRLFVHYNPGGDYWLNPLVIYNPGRGVNVGLGAHVFGGDPPGGTLTSSSFGLFDNNDFVYFKLTLAF